MQVSINRARTLPVLTHTAQHSQFSASSGEFTTTILDHVHSSKQQESPSLNPSASWKRQQHARQNVHAADAVPPAAAAAASATASVPNTEPAASTVLSEYVHKSRSAGLPAADYVARTAEQETPSNESPMGGGGTRPHASSAMCQEQEGCPQRLEALNLTRNGEWFSWAQGSW